MSGKIYTKVQERQRQAEKRTQTAGTPSKQSTGVWMNGLIQRREEIDQQARDSLMRQMQKGGGDPCGCVGPQNGQPLCPCQMRTVEVKGGRYTRTTDLGPATALDSQLSVLKRYGA